MTYTIVEGKGEWAVWAITASPQHQTLISIGPTKDEALTAALEKVKDMAYQMECQLRDLRAQA